MNALQWFELLMNCTIQAVVVIAAAGMLERRTADSTTKTRIWAACFVSLVGLAVSGDLHASFGAVVAVGVPRPFAAAVDTFRQGERAVLEQVGAGVGDTRQRDHAEQC